MCVIGEFALCGSVLTIPFAAEGLENGLKIKTFLIFGLNHYPYILHLGHCFIRRIGSICL